MEIRAYDESCPEIESVYLKIVKELARDLYATWNRERAIRMVYSRLGYQNWRAHNLIEWDMV